MSRFLRHLWPQSLWRQLLILTALVLMLAQILSMTLFAVMVLRPDLHRVAETTAHNLAAVIDASAEAPPEARAVMIARLQDSKWIALWPGDIPPDASGPAPRPMERAFMRALVKALGDREDLYWRTDGNRRLWIHVNFGPDPYWISLRSMSPRGPTGMMLVCTLVSAALSLFVAWLIGVKALKPLQTLREASERLDLSGRNSTLPEDGPTEIAAVSKSFNRMTQRLAQGEADRALVLAGISHDVRTPLARLKLALAMMKGDDAALMDSANRQIDTIDRIMSQFLTFARGFEAEAEAYLEAQALINELIVAYADAGVDGSADGGPILCRPEAVRRALANLLENALRYGEAPVHLSARLSEEGWVLSVRDSGQGIPEMHTEALRQPFTRGNEARTPAQPGSGLGLAIADKVARLHEGELRFTHHAEGFEAALILPRASYAQSVR
ncbi:ATP-binding protein [Asticcacaulis sp. ZE23SCel15]|uniref:ATP-binding protein n=1 Tax=Asticcacaulis sp. ZE23SCel15 TaxID=3059027 RepID=UPI002660353C|nr:ATP-binding protein [Asticcacaulis sp. ZE23SCel15]WKL56699.1 ATP-binding protein [Asticcacaulis sp. ZE23SCel15]